MFGRALINVCGCYATATDDLVQEALGHITEGICRPLKVVICCWL